MPIILYHNIKMYVLCISIANSVQRFLLLCTYGALRCMLRYLYSILCSILLIMWNYCYDNVALVCITVEELSVLLLSS